MSKHTPGPWKIVEREVMEEDDSVYPRSVVGGEGEFLVVYLESETVAAIARKKPGTLWDVSPTKEANAQLIVAAPDLLAALKEAEDFVDRHTEDWYKPGQRLLKQIHAAINKAEGNNNNE